MCGSYVCFFFFRRQCICRDKQAYTHSYIHSRSKTASPAAKFTSSAASCCFGLFSDKPTLKESKKNRLYFAVLANLNMETLQRIVCRQWTDLSHKRNSKRLKPFDEPFIFSEEEEDNNNYCLEEGKPNSPHLEAVFGSPLHFYNSSSSEALAYSENLHQPAHSMSPSMSAKNRSELDLVNYQLETGNLYGFGSASKSTDKFSHFQQPLQKVLRATNQIRDKFQSSTSTGSALSVSASSSAQISAKSKAAAQKNEASEEMDEDKPKKQTRIMEVRNKLSNGRKKKSDNQNLLMFEELDD